MSKESSSNNLEDCFILNIKCFHLKLINKDFKINNHQDNVNCLDRKLITQLENIWKEMQARETVNQSQSLKSREEVIDEKIKPQIPKVDSSRSQTSQQNRKV